MGVLVWNKFDRVMEAGEDHQVVLKAIHLVTLRGDSYMSLEVYPHHLPKLSCMSCDE